MFVFTGPGQVAKLILADGFRFVMFVSGAQPKAIPITEQGPWEIDIPELLAKGKYPIVVSSFDVAHVPMIQRMTVAMVDEMLAAIAMEAQRGETRSGSTAKPRQRDAKQSPNLPQRGHND